MGTAPEAGPGKAEMLEGNPDLAKVSSHLLEARRLARQGMDPEALAGAVPLVGFADGSALIEVRLERLDDSILVRLLEAGLGVDETHYEVALVYGRCELERLDEIAAVHEVATIAPRPRARTRRAPL